MVTGEFDTADETIKTLMEKFKEEFDLGETAYQTRMKAMTAGDSEFKNGYAKVNRQEVYINRKIYNAWKSSEAEKNMLWVDY